MLFYGFVNSTKNTLYSYSKRRSLRHIYQLIAIESTAKTLCKIKI